MKPEQRSIISVLREHSARRRFALAVFLIAIVTTVAVFWALRISGLTLEDGDSGNATGTDAAAETATGTDGTSESGSINLGETLMATALGASAGNTTDYYLATTVDYSSGLTSESDYIVYTEIGGVYYIVAADGSLTQCTTISTISSATGTGPYYVTDTGKIAYGASEAGYANYKWTANSYDATTGTCYALNSSTGNYMAPDDMTSITTFATSHTGEVTLSGDFTLAYTFSDTGGTSNWFNYLVELTDGTVYLDVRADNYGWITEGGADDSITFDSTALGWTTDEWSEWQSVMAAGADVTVTITKSGSDFIVEMTVNGTHNGNAYSNTMKITATVSAFEDAKLTVYLSGESCTLSGVSYTYEATDSEGNVTTGSSSTSSLAVFTTDKKMTTFTDDNSTDGATVAHGSYGLTVSGTSLTWQSGSTSQVFYFAQVEETAEGYYFAESVTLYDASQSQGDKYIAYTQIGSDYYLVSAVDGSLLKCTDLSAYSDDNAKALLSTDAGVYVWEIDDSTNEPVFKFTSDDTADFNDYWWTLTSDNADSTGSGTYTVANSANGTYLAPGLKTETINLTGSSTNSQSSSYSLSGYGTIEFSVTDIYNRGANMGFTVYVYNSSNQYVRLSLAETRDNGWSAATITPTITCSYTNAYGVGSMTIDPTVSSNELVITITTSSDGVVINLYNTASDETYIYYVDGADFSGGAYAYLYENNGSLSLTAATADASTTVTSQDISGSYTDDDGFSNTSDEATATKKTLSGDFDITYTFTNKSSSNSDTACNYVVEVYNGDTIYIDVRANAVGWTWDTGTAASADDLTFNGSDIDDAWQTAMYNGAASTVRVIRTGNTFLFLTSMGDYTSVSYVTLSKFDGCDAQVYLMCNYSTLSDITYTDNTNSNFTGNYVRVSSSEKTSTLTADASTSYTWEAASEGEFSESFCLLAQLATDTVNTAEIEWVDTSYALAGSTATGTAVTTLSGETATELNNSGGLTLTFSLARVRGYTVHFDGTNGGFALYNNYTAYYYVDNGADTSLTVKSGMAYGSGAANITLTTYCNAVGDSYVRLPYAVNPSTVTGRYDYYLQGWYDINSFNSSVNGGDYYSDYSSDTYVYDTATGQIYENYTYDNWQYSEIQITQDSVFYADWVVQTYDTGITSSTDGLVTDIANTSNFITTKVFDYNDILDLYTGTLTSSSISSTTHTESWTLVDRGGTALLGTSTGFLFMYTGGDSNILCRMGNRNDENGSEQKKIVTGIYSAINNLSNPSYTINDLFDTSKAFNASDGTGIYGVTYVGEGGYLFQYDSETGYYYFDSSKNAAFYDQEDQRFYLFEGIVAETGSGTSTSDFLPFNYDSGYTLTDGTTTTINIADIDYWFGMSNEINFYLPNAIPDASSAGSSNSGIVNQTTVGSDMVFKFMGDDDVWVLLGDYLVLDLGGLHGACYGEINFSTGIVTWIDPEYVSTAVDTTSSVIGIKSDLDTTSADYKSYYHTSTIEEMLTAAGASNAEVASLLAYGSKELTMYYLERGSGQSNAAIYASLSPVYTVKMAKVIETGTGYDTSAGGGVTFEVYTSSDFENSSPITTVTTAADGVLTINGLVPGTTYYLKETVAPDGFPLSYKYITIYADSAGNVTVCVYDSSGGLLETLSCVEGTSDYDGSESIEDIIKSDDYKVFTLSTDEDEEGVTGLLMVEEADPDYTYLLGDLSVFGASNTAYGSYLIATMTYKNHVEYELPATGSTGILPYISNGVVLVLVSVTGLLMIAFYNFVWVRRFRTNRNKKEYSRDGRRREKRGMRFSKTRDHPRKQGAIHGRDAPETEVSGSAKRNRAGRPETK